MQAKTEKHHTILINTAPACANQSAAMQHECNYLKSTVEFNLRILHNPANNHQNNKFVVLLKKSGQKVCFLTTFLTQFLFF